MNTTDSENATRNNDLRPYVRESFYIALGLQWLNTVLIISLNTAVIVTILRYKKKSRLYFLLMNMAIADLITGLIDALINALERTLGHQYLNYWWFGGDFLCRLQRTLSSTSLCASNFILAATSVDRALVVAKPMLNFKRGYALQKVLIGTCWLLSAAISSPMFAIHSLEYINFSYLQSSQKVSLCSMSLTNEGWKILYYLLLIFCVLLPLAIIVVSYCCLIYYIFKRARSPPNSIHGFDNLKLSLVFNKGLPNSKARSIKLTFGIVLSFIGAWTPFFVIFYLNIFHDFDEPVMMYFMTTFYWNCSVNPIVFFVFHKRRAASAPASLYSSDPVVTKLTSLSSSTRNTTVRVLPEGENTPLK